MLLAAAARRMGIAGKLAAVIPDGRDPTRVVHPLPEILLARVLAIACGYADADDLDRLRADPAFKLACGRLPESGADLMSQPTVSRWENAPGLRDLLRARPGPGRALLCQLCRAAGGGGARHRRHARCRPRPSAAVAVQRPSRRALLSADPRLRHGHGPPGRGDPAAGQDTFGQGGARPSAPSRPGDPPPLARDRRSPSAATATMAGPRSWTSARRCPPRFRRRLPGRRPVPPDCRRTQAHAELSTGAAPPRQDHPAPPTPAQLPITPRRPPAKRSHDQDQARHHWPGHGE